MSLEVAVIGSGISGLGAAWALSARHRVTVYEADSRVGGHTNTVDVATPDGNVAVDTGFIVYNEKTYPNLTRLFGALGVPTRASDMSFAFSVDHGLEYAASLRGVLGGNLTRPRFRSMLRDIDRFRRLGTGLEPEADETLDDLLRRHRFSPGFIEDYLYPMTGAIWSSSSDEIGAYPAAPILRFLHNHGLIEIVGRPEWRTVVGGGRQYLDRLTTGLEGSIRLSTPATSVTREGERVVVESLGEHQVFDQVVLATHSDQALTILGPDATTEEREALGAIRYRPNLAVLHSDSTLMPRRRSLWASWNAMAPSGRSAGPASVTYWMNRLQGLDTSQQLFVSLNPLRQPDTRLTHGVFRYAHPQFDVAAWNGQRALSAIQGRNNTWFAGAYLGYGFHEDGLQAGLNVAAALGSPAPWHGSFEPVSSATIEPDLVAA